MQWACPLKFRSSQGTAPQQLLRSKLPSIPLGLTCPSQKTELAPRAPWCRAACDDVTTLLTSDNTQYLDRIHPEVAMWREAVYREREAVDKERETVKAILKREQEARDKERTAKWAAIKRELQVVHQHREECQKREAAEQRVKRLQRMLGDANTQLLAAANRLSMRGILEATQEMVERKYEDEMAALQPCTENSNKQKGNEAAWEILFAHDQDLRDAIAAATEWSVEQLPAKLDQLRMRLANPLYTKSLALIQESKVAVQVLQLKDVTDERDVAALQCLCERLWCVMYHEMSVETYDRFARALKRTAVGGGVLT